MFFIMKDGVELRKPLPFGGTIIAHREVAGGGAQAPGVFVLVDCNTQFVHWFHNYQDGGYHSGRYFDGTEREQAESTFAERCARG